MEIRTIESENRICWIISLNFLFVKYKLKNV